MTLDRWQAIAKLRASPNRETFDIVLNEEMTCPDQAFLKDAFETLFFHAYYKTYAEKGLKETFLEVARAIPYIEENFDIDGIASEALKEATFVLMNHDLEMLGHGIWDFETVEGRLMSLDRLKGNPRKPGLHLFAGGMGSGKSMETMVPLFKELIGTDTRAMLIVPNQDVAHSLAKKLGCNHYECRGHKQEDKQQAWRENRQLVACAQSFHIMMNHPDATPPKRLFIDEGLEVLEYIQDDALETKPNASTWQALQSIFKWAHHLTHLYVATADTPTAYLGGALTDMAEIISEKYRRKERSRRGILSAAAKMECYAHWYKTSEHWLKDKLFTQFDTKEDLVFSTISRIEDGEKVFLFTGVSDSTNPNFSRFRKLFEKYLPGKKIIALDGPAMKNTHYGKMAKEMGLGNFIAYARKELDVDLFMVSPICKSQHSILFDDEERHLAYDRTVIFGDYLINSPWCLRQASNRARQTTLVDYWIAEDPSIQERELDKHKGAVLCEKHFGRVDYSNAATWERAYHRHKERSIQFEEACKANRNLLFRKLVENHGATVRPSFLVVDDSYRDRYAEILNQVKAEVEVDRKERYENHLTARMKMVMSVRQWDEMESSWMTANWTDDTWAEIEMASKLDAEAAERLIMVLEADDETRRKAETPGYETTWVPVGRLLDEIFGHLSFASFQQHRVSLAEWALHGDGPIFFDTLDPAWKALDESAEELYQNTKNVIWPRRMYGRGIGANLKMVCDEMGFKITGSASEGRKRIYRDHLFEQLIQEKPGKLRRGQTWPQRWEKIDEILREKIKLPNYRPTKAEREHLITLSGVIMIEKKSFVHKSVVEAYWDWLAIIKDRERHCLTLHQSIDDLVVKEAPFDPRIEEDLEEELHQ